MGRIKYVPDVNLPGSNLTHLAHRLLRDTPVSLTHQGWKERRSEALAATPFYSQWLKTVFYEYFKIGDEVARDG